MSKKVFVQGDRDASGIAAIAAAIAAVFAKAGTELNLGAYGELVRIFTAAGCKATCFGHRKDDQGKCPADVPFVDICAYLARLADTPHFNWLDGVMKFECREMAFGFRLGTLLAASDAFLFFSGREGTQAHLFPALAFAKKYGKRVALVGWDAEDKASILQLAKGGEDWLRAFDADEDPGKIVGFLLGA